MDFIYISWIVMTGWCRNGIEWLMDVAHRYPQAEIVQAGAVVTKSGYEYLSMMNNKRVSEYTDDEKIIKRYMLRSIYPSTVWNKLIKTRNGWFSTTCFSRKDFCMKMIIGISLLLNM